MKWIITALTLISLSACPVMGQDLNTLSGEEVIAHLLQTPVSDLAAKSCAGYDICIQQATALKNLVRTDPTNYVQTVCEFVPTYWRISAEVPVYKYRMLCYANALYWLTQHSPKVRMDCGVIRDNSTARNLCYSLFDLKLTYNACYNKHTESTWSYEKSYKDCFVPVLANKLTLSDISGRFSGKTPEEVRGLVRPVPWSEITAKSCAGHAGCIAVATRLEGKSYTNPEDVIYNMCEQIPPDYSTGANSTAYRLKAYCYANAMYWVGYTAPENSDACKSIDFSAPWDTFRTCIKAAMIRQQYPVCRQTLPESSSNTYEQSYSTCFYRSVVDIMRDFD